MNENEKRCIEILEMMIEDEKTSPPAYVSTDFWKVGGALIANEIKEKGLRNFRSHQSANRFYVPLYERAYTQQNVSLINKAKQGLKEIAYKNVGGDGDYENFLHGYYDAFADYRVLCSAHNNFKPDLSRISESNVGEPSEHFVFDGKRFSRSFLNYLLGLSFVKKNEDIQNVSDIVEIGGGYGTLGEILLKSNDAVFYVDIDLPPVSAIATYYLSEVLGENAVLSYDKTRYSTRLDVNDIKKEYKVMILCPWQLPKLVGSFDMFVNFISFQEMEPEIVINYINQIIRFNPKHILLRNLREGKERKASHRIAGVDRPMMLDDMINAFHGYTLVAKDVNAFGEIKIDNFHSELAYLKRE